MRNKLSFLFVALSLLAVLLSACSGAAVSSQNPEPPRILNINGHGEVSITPDLAYINIGVHTEDQDAATAVNTNNIQTQKVITALKALGIAGEDIHTINFNIYQGDKYNMEGMLEGKFFFVDNQVNITARDLSKLGDILTASIDAGANNINGIQFDVSEKSEALAQAREKAVADAKAQAQELARLSGVELGEITSLNVYNSGGIPTPYYAYGKGGGGGAAEAAVPVSPGLFTISVEVNISYTIK